MLLRLSQFNRLLAYGAMTVAMRSLRLRDRQACTIASRLMITGTAARENMSLPEEVIVRQKLPSPWRGDWSGHEGTANTPEINAYYMTARWVIKGSVQVYAGQRCVSATTGLGLPNRL